VDIAYLYGGPHWERASIYLPPGIEPPEEFDAVNSDTGATLQFVRISDRSLACEKVLVRMEGKRAVYRGCGQWECHRGERIGRCQCGSHSDAEAAPQRAYPAEPAWFPPMTQDQQRRAAERQLRP
jgi:hypothetical protein